MSLNKSKGQMYPWIDFTWNVIKGKCPHDCVYCYCKQWGEQSSLHFDEKELKTDLGSGNFIFVGSSCDMWASVIPQAWIDAVWLKCLLYPDNLYLFQSKNPSRFLLYELSLIGNALWGTTIETNRIYPQFMGNAPTPYYRVKAMLEIGQPKMVSIEPIMDFDPEELVRYMRLIKPEFVSIGADSKGHGLPEPTKEKIYDLVSALKEFTEVLLKSNLKRLGVE